MKQTFTQQSGLRFGNVMKSLTAAAVLCTAGLNAQTTFNYTGSLQTYTVPVGVTTIHVEARGAAGGSVTTSCAATGGRGAMMSGDFTVTPGEVLTIMVGQQGLTNGSDAGGGGGTFVVRTGNVPLLCAGGGGGATNNIGSCGGNRNGIDATITTSGTASANGVVAGGINGNGGGASTGSGGGGGGFYTDGVAGTGLANNNGKAFVNGGAGGTGNNNDFGGYGGGGAGWFTGGNGGGGGGYSGGGTSGSQPFSGGGGGGSYNAGTNQVNTAGVQTGNGIVVITVPFSATVSLAQAINCNGGNNGSLTASVAGGTSPYTYAWAPTGGTAATATGLSAGTYTVTITDATSATIAQTFTITEPSAITATGVGTNLVCNSGNNGTATATVSGGTPGYTYLWSNGGTTPTIIGLAAGVYTYTVTDVNGCTSVASTTITEPAALTGTYSSSSILCNGGLSTVSLSATGGISPYIGDSTFQVNAGGYTYVITDDNGCTTSVSVTVTEPAAIAVSSSMVNVACFGDSTGSIDLSVAGGTAPFTFNWNSGAFTTEDLTNIPAGSYSGILTDANGCQDSGTVVITQPLAALAVSVTSTNPTTCSGTNGMIDATISGGTPAYTYVWSNGPSTEDNNNVAAGSYTLTVTDTAGCTQTASVTLVDPAAPTVTVAFSIDTVCTLDAPVTLSGGSPAGGTYSGTAVSSGIFTPASAAVGANTITYTYTDANTGCSGSSTDVIYVDPCAGIAESNISAVSFSIYPNPNNGTFTVLNSSVNAGDIAVYDAQGRVVQSVRLNGGSQSQITIDVAGIYMIRMIDANGNSAVQQVIVE
ncbi:MAG: hypothetical protein RL007_1955 [Bacteroidota bacterium]|jgi:hypothetical protein